MSRSSTKKSLGHSEINPKAAIAFEISKYYCSCNVIIMTEEFSFQNIPNDHGDRSFCQFSRNHEKLTFPITHVCYSSKSTSLNEKSFPKSQF